MSALSRIFRRKPKPPSRIEVLREVLDHYALSIPNTGLPNREDEAYHRGHQMAVAQVVEIIDHGWTGNNTPVLAAELERLRRVRNARATIDAVVKGLPA